MTPSLQLPESSERGTQIIQNRIFYKSLNLLVIIVKGGKEEPNKKLFWFERQNERIKTREWIKKKIGRGGRDGSGGSAGGRSRGGENQRNDRISNPKEIYRKILERKRCKVADDSGQSVASLSQGKFLRIRIRAKRVTKPKSHFYCN